MSDPVIVWDRKKPGWLTVDGHTIFRDQARIFEGADLPEEIYENPAQYQIYNARGLGV